MSRLQSVEVLRIISAYCIVWYHTGTYGYTIAYAGLSVFIILTLTFEVSVNYWRKPDPKALFIKLLVPWAFWFVFYGVVNIVKGQPFIGRNSNSFTAILAGTQVHLWYIPFIVIVIIGVGAAKSYLTRPQLLATAFMICLVLMVSAPIWRPWSLSIPSPGGAYFQALVAVFLGIIIGTRDSHRFGNFALGLTLIGLTILGLGRTDGVAWPYLIAAIAVLIALGCRCQLLGFDIYRISSNMLGVYLVHPFFIILIRNTFRITGVSYPTAVFILTLLFILIFDIGYRKALPFAPSVI